MAMAPNRNSSEQTAQSDGQRYQARTVDAPDLSDEALPMERGNDAHTGPPSCADETQPIIAEDGPRKSIQPSDYEPRSWTWRSLILGLFIGVIIVMSNVYFGLQTGWISGMTMPAALIGYAFFSAFSRYLTRPFSAVENVLVQTAAGTMGAMPLGCGFVGVIPALEYLLKPEENGPLKLSLGTLILFAIGICLFGVVIAVPLRKQVIIREKLRFPTGSATALMIGILHGGNDEKMLEQRHEYQPVGQHEGDNEAERSSHEERERQAPGASEAEVMDDWSINLAKAGNWNWRSKVRLMGIAFGVSAVYTLITYFLPILHNLPILGWHMALNWSWTLNPSPAYVGQGIIMGPTTTTHMLLGAIFGWAILSPIAKYKGWAPGPVKDWETGSKGWIVWVSLAIMLADALVSLGWLILRPVLKYLWHNGSGIVSNIREGEWEDLRRRLLPVSPARKGYSTIPPSNDPNDPIAPSPLKPAHESNEEPEPDAPASQLIGARTFFIGLAVSIVIYYISLHLSFPSVLPFGASTLALVLGLLLSVLGVRALGSTDLNPVSGISKLTQLFFALAIPASHPHAISINLLAGAVSESGALQAGDLMQDLKTGHLLGASPAAQFYGQLIGSVIGAVVSAVVYKLYTRVYDVPGDLFPVPTAYVWVFTARLVTGSGLPPKAAEFALGAGAVFAVLTAIRTYGANTRWVKFLPGGIAFAVGMYNTPSFTLARAVGGAINGWWTGWRGNKETEVVVLASGLILGEGLLSIVNLIMAGAGVPHL